MRAKILLACLFCWLVAYDYFAAAIIVAAVLWCLCFTGQDDNDKPA